MGETTTERELLSAAERERYVRSVSFALDLLARIAERDGDLVDPCIAHDAQDRFRALAAELREARGQLARVTSDRDTWQDDANEYAGEQREARAEVERMRVALESVKRAWLSWASGARKDEGPGPTFTEIHAAVTAGLDAAHPAPARSEREAK